MVFPNHNSHSNPTSSPVSAATTPSVSPRISLPSEANALLQSLLQENNIMSNSTYSSNTFSRDFCLFESDESQFDYPLFDNTKLQSNLHLFPLHQNHAIQQHHHQHHHHHHQQPQQQQSVQNTNSNPLCTPQTPSLDLLENERVMEPIGFDGFSVFLEESLSEHGSASAAVTLIHVNDMSMASHFGNENVDGAGFSTMDLSSSHANPALVDTPFTPYLDTPFETPYQSALDIGDSSCSNLFVDIDRVASGIENVDRRESARIGSGFSSIPLFPEYGYAPTIDHCTFGNTIEPATLLMASPAIKQENDYYQESYSLSDYSSAISSSASEDGSPYHELDGKVDHVEDLDNSFYEEVEEVESIKEDDEYGYIKEEDEDEDDEDEDIKEEDDDEYIPSRSLAAATSSRKRKAPSVINYGRNFVSINDNKASATPFKRTRPELASPYGGKKRSSKNKPSTVKRFPCRHDGCELRFARLYNLHTHERTHDPDQVRPFICSTSHCNKAFSRKHDLARHEASVHNGERNFKCHTCGKPFSRQDGLRRHLTIKSSSCAVPNANVDALAGGQNKPRWSEYRHFGLPPRPDDINAPFRVDHSSPLDNTFPWNPGILSSPKLRNAPSNWKP
ncbi:hypothetical protein BGZ76_000428, partial [Entomortierella beljakovae]